MVLFLILIVYDIVMATYGIYLNIINSYGYVCYLFL